VHGFVQQSGGQIEIRSVIGGGTTVCLYLPRYAGDAVAAATETAGARDGAACGETILVIDDEEGVRALMVEVLEEAGYTTMAAGDGPTGLQILQSDARVDLLITDVGLPGGMNGRQVADAARTSRTGLKVLFVTGYAETAALGDCDLDPGMEVLTKPFAMAALGSRARQIIDGGTLLRQAAD
jgi:CheY-like chemotaxis protein